MLEEVQIYLSKAEESLAGAESEFVNQRYNNCANRCYYSCFQVAVFALVREGVRPRGERAQWGHDFVQAEFVGQLINRRKVYPPGLRDALMHTFALRQAADYGRVSLSETQASRALRRARLFLSGIQSKGGGM